MSSSEGGQVTGTQDKDYNLIWFAEQCLSNALRLETYVQDADRDGDSELAGFFRRAQAESKKGADQAKSMLAKRLADEITTTPEGGASCGGQETLTSAFVCCRADPPDPAARLLGRDTDRDVDPGRPSSHQRHGASKLRPQYGRAGGWAGGIGSLSSLGQPAS